jgi:spermidine synthase
MKAVYLTLFFISAAILAFQVVLTRFFALAQGHHFAFMAISLALLGAGASGTYLSLRPPTEATCRRTVAAGAVLFTVSLPAAYLATNYLPFDAYRLAWERVQLLWLSLYYLSLTVPFFFGGLVIGAVLSTRSQQAGSIYAVNLLGSGLGPPLALLALATVGGPATVMLCTLLGWLAVLSTQLPAVRQKQWLKIAGYAAITVALFYFILNPPPILDVRLTPYKSLSQAQLYPGSRIIFSQWNAVSRVDVLQSEGIRSAPGLSFAYPGQLPRQLGLMIDGDNLSPITGPQQPDFTRYLPLSLAFQLRPGANILILEPGGGLAVLTALEHGAGSVTIAQSNPTTVAAVHNFGGRLYNDARVTVVVDNPRSFLRRSRQQFDLIILPLTDSFRPVTAGAYTLGEDYRYTVEAFEDMLTHLAPDGLLVVERWLQLPPSESLRLWGTAIESLRRVNPQSDPAARMLALRTLQTSLIVASRSPLSPADLQLTRNFAAELQFDLVWLPDIRPAEVNRFSIVPDEPYYRTFAGLLAAPNPLAFYNQYPYAVTPPTDDYPFFFHFFKWQQTPEILQTLGKTWQPFGGSGYLVLAVLLALVVILSAGLILLPLFWLRNRSAKVPLWPAKHGFVTPKSGSLETNQPSALQEYQPFHLTFRYLLYFTLLGLGFLFVEIPLLQRFILYLGQPAYAFTVVISAILGAAGLGSGYLSQRLSLRIVLPLIVFLTIAYPVLLPVLFESALHLPFFGRVIVTVLALFPLGALLGIPFPRGLALVGETAPGLAPWVWAVNGCASVVSAVLAALVALTWGFAAVLWGAALAYGLAGGVMWPLLARQRHKPDPAPVGA